MIVTFEHFRTIPAYKEKPGYCIPVGKKWFRRYGQDWRKFIGEGLDESEFLRTGDALGIALVDWAHECARRSAAFAADEEAMQ